MTRLNSIRDNLEGLGVQMCARCAANGDVQQSAGSDDDVQRLAALDADVTRLNGELDVLRAEHAAQVTRIAELEAQPTAPKAGLLNVARANDFEGNQVERVQDTDAFKNGNDVTRAAMLMKDALTRPQIVSGFRS